MPKGVRVQVPSRAPSKISKKLIRKDELFYRSSSSNQSYLYIWFNSFDRYIIIYYALFIKYIYEKNTVLL
jgi:hypothetical protein